MGSSRFPLRLALRLLLLLGLMAGFARSVAAEGLVAAPLLAGAAVLLAAVELFLFLRRTNRELARFFEAVSHQDFTQGFAMPREGAGFGDLGRAFGAVMKRFRDARGDQEAEIRALRAVVEHVPVPLLLLEAGKVTSLNRAARRFLAPFGSTRQEELDRIGEGLAPEILGMRPGERRLVQAREADGRPLRLSVTVADLLSAGRRQRIVALQNISGEIEATEAAAFEQLVHVLTHEIMNSLTPVSSLAETAAGLLEAAGEDPEALEDAREATATVARRAASLVRFVDSYRRLARLPRPKPERIAARALFGRLAKLGEAERARAGVELAVEVVPNSLVIEADPGQIEQALINLLRNAIEALAGRADGRIELSARRDRQGRTVIEVADNGPGIDEEIADKVFVPFFTTRREGSGIGLALTRQIMIAHKGAVMLRRGPNGGALFRLIF